MSRQRRETLNGHRAAVICFTGLSGSGMGGRSFLLCGGNKKSQTRDIELAKACWADWKRRQI